ncbi:MAG: hypothetical protein MUC81_12165 [Bacteroidia bacterium]|jgi:hypothetical protein|nr:hypothetical protein [Bacteroidia bacterium]
MLLLSTSVNYTLHPAESESQDQNNSLVVSLIENIVGASISIEIAEISLDETIKPLSKQIRKSFFVDTDYAYFTSYSKDKTCNLESTHRIDFKPSLFKLHYTIVVLKHLI